MTRTNMTYSASPDFTFATRRRLAIAMVLLLTALSFYMGLSEPASANHGDHTLEVLFELNETDAGTTVTVGARLYPDATPTPVQIDFEVESGPNNPDGETRSSPDKTCTVPADGRDCQVEFSAGPGVQSIRGWIDHDGGSTVEADPTEGRYSGEYLLDPDPPNSGPDTGDCTTGDLAQSGDACPGEAAPGLVGEPDQTDVVEIAYTTDTTRLNCQPEAATRPNTEPGSSVSYTCIATDAQGNGRADVTIDGENMDGANDPDNGTENSSADYDDLCTTGETGECSGAVSPDEGQEGGADICFWTDTDNDSDMPIGDGDSYDPPGDEENGQEIADGFDCNSGEPVGEAENNDLTDKVHVDWSEGSEPDIDHVHLWIDGTASADCVTGTALSSEAVPGSKAVVACPHASGHEPVSGLTVNFTESGPAGPNSGAVTTDENGRAVFEVRSTQGGDSTIVASTAGKTSNQVRVSFIETWASLGGGLIDGPDVASWAPGRLDVFIRGGDNGVWHRAFDGTWGPWESLGGNTTTDPTAVSWSEHRIDMFSRGADNALWHRAWDGASWGPWESLGGILSSGPDVASWGPNRLDIFARGADNAMWHMSWNGASFSGWESLGGNVNLDPGAVSWGLNRVDVFARGADNAIWQNSWDGTSWVGWVSQGGSVTSHPDPASSGVNRLEIVARGGDNGFWHKWWNGSSWSQWEPLNGILTSGPGAVTKGDQTSVFARGGDGALWWKAYKPPA